MAEGFNPPVKSDTHLSLIYFSKWTTLWLKSVNMVALPWVEDAQYVLHYIVVVSPMSFDKYCECESPKEQLFNTKIEYKHC